MLAGGFSLGATPVYLEQPDQEWDPSASYPPGAIKSEFGRRLQNRMTAKGWCQSDLARYADTGRDNVSAYVRGRAIPGPAILRRLADVLGCAPTDLLPPSVAAASMRGQPDDAMSLEMRQLGGGKVFLRLNRTVTLDQASRIMAILTEIST